jgi:Tol biopolymer transport system component
MDLPMGLAPGTRLGRYEILAPIGAGGMGEVYRARDSRLERDVALKLLPPTGDRFRFQAEAKAVAALRHPNVIAIFDVGENYLITELIDGSPLPIPATPMRRLLDLAIQIADGLTAAHAAGFIHRDLKPENILVSKDDRVKILDFGLAKRIEYSESDTTQTQKLTEEAVVAGTVAYMSPEQVRGAPLDNRSDQFAFGLVLYEMVTGKRAFQRATAPEIMTAILRESAEPLPVDVPAPLRWTIERCLAKEPSERYDTTRGLYLELRKLGEHMAEAITAGPAVPPPKALRAADPARKPWVLVSVAAAMLCGAALWYVRPSRPATAAQAEQKLIPLFTERGDKSMPALSWDGAKIAYVWRPDGEEAGVFTRMAAAGSTPVRLTDRPGSSAWSADGRYLAFLPGMGPLNSLFILRATGSQQRKLTDIAVWTYPASRSMTWTPDGKWILVPDKPSTTGPYELTAVSVETGEKRRITNPPADVFGDNFPRISPDGRSLAFMRISAFSVVDVYTQPLEVAADRVATPKRLTNVGWAMSSLLWSGNSHEVLVTALRGGNRLWRVSVDRRGPPRMVPSVPTVGNFVGASATGDRLAWVQASPDFDIYRQDLPEPGKKAPPSVRLIASTRQEMNARVSPDGTKIVFPSDRTGSWEIWLAASDGGHPVPLTSFGGPENGSPSWSPDGSKIAFDTRVRGNGDIYLVSAAGGKPRPLTNGPGDNLSPFWSRDGRWIYFVSNRLGQEQLWKMSIAGGPAVQLTHSGAVGGQESMDGNFVFYAKDYNRPTTLWRVPSAGGEEMKVLDELCQAKTYDVTDQGIYYLHRPSNRDRRRGLMFYSFAMKQVAFVTGIDRQFFIGLSISPDRHWFAFSGPSDSRTPGSDVMLLEHFR